MGDKSPSSAATDKHARANAEAKRLVDELSTVAGAKRLGAAAYETAKADMAKARRKLKAKREP